jgi:hypothetical protein
MTFLNEFFFSVVFGIVIFLNLFGITLTLSLLISSILWMLTSGSNLAQEVLKLSLSPLVFGAGLATTKFDVSNK